jgi:HK97 family phage portal protein
MEERSGSGAITITQNASAEQLLAFFGSGNVILPKVTVSNALRVPAVLSAVTFLSRTLATLDLIAYRDTGKGPLPIGGKLGTIVKDAPNPEWSGYGSRTYFWQQVFTMGRGLMLIVRDERGQPVELWPVNSNFVRVTSDSMGRKSYTVSVQQGQFANSKTYPASDVIDVPFMLAPDQINVLSPINMGEKAISLALAMGDFASTFFASGGVPPLQLSGPLPSGPDAANRAMAEINRAIDNAKNSNKPIFAMPPGHTLSPVGIDPSKGQMEEARRFQVEEIARVFQIPPMFLQDLTRATFSNSESQDLFLTKHLLGQWAKALEDEMNLKLFGQFNSKRYVRHDFASLLRGDFSTRMEALTRSVQGAIRTPNEARALEGLPAIADAAADGLFIQGATVPISEAGEDAADESAELKNPNSDNQEPTQNEA